MKEFIKSCNTLRESIRALACNALELQSHPEIESANKVCVDAKTVMGIGEVKGHLKVVRDKLMDANDRLFKTVQVVEEVRDRLIRFGETFPTHNPEPTLEPTEQPKPCCGLRPAPPTSPKPEPQKNNLSFAQALELLRAGKKLRRLVWAEGIWVAIQFPGEHSKMTQPYFYVNAYEGLSPMTIDGMDVLAFDWQVFEEEAPRHPETPCCGYKGPMDMPYAVMWNPYNGVVQCHNCGHVFKPTDDPVPAPKA